MKNLVLTLCLACVSTMAVAKPVNAQSPDDEVYLAQDQIQRSPWRDRGSTATNSELRFAFALLMPAISFSSVATKTGPVFDRYYTRISRAAEKERLTNYAIQLQYGEGSRGIIAVYAKDESGAKAAQARARKALRFVIEKRGIDPARITWRYEGACSNEQQIILYLMYKDEADPAPDPKCLR